MAAIQGLRDLTRPLARHAPPCRQERQLLPQQPFPFPA